MCGIFAVLNSDKKNETFYKEQFYKGIKRGPEDSKILAFHNVLLGFHRLAINGLNENSNQPFNIKNIVLICNGEIYNYKYLYELMNVTPETNSDCEVIIHLYLKYGIEQTLQMLDGVYSFVLYDLRLESNLDNFVYFARDAYGVRPLYLLKNKSANNNNNNNNNVIACASELKCLTELLKLHNNDKMYFFSHQEYDYIKENINYEVVQFQPGTFSTYKLLGLACSKWIPVKENQTYITPSFPYICNYYNSLMDTTIEDEKYETNIIKYLCDAVKKRCLNTERPIACLLSGGLDSSLITALVNHFYKMEFGLDKKIETYSIGLKGSEDLIYAKKVANYIGSKHTEIILTEKEMFNSIPDVIYAIESYDTTSVRASIGNYLIGKYISTNSDAKVIFNGDGSDELCGGYLYMKNCPDCIEFDSETRRLLKDIHLFDVLRSDKCISSHGLEPRTPFLDKTFVNYYLSIPQKLRFESNKIMEKYLLRNSFTIENFQDVFGKQILPNEILWRRKEAFSDGVSKKGRSLYVILQEFISTNLKLENYYEQDIMNKYEVNIETEKLYYKNIFNCHFPNCETIVPYYWMPRYTNATDPSARTLEMYENNILHETNNFCI
jgi:asparagine synthase (glutamine-hydrolysing)